MFWAVMRARATVVVRRGGKFLLSLEKDGMWLLPGGKIERGELGICAAARELYEETGLIAESIRFQFQYESFSNTHLVYSVEVSDTAVAYCKSEVVGVRWVDIDELRTLRLSPATDEILKLV